MIRQTGDTKRGQGGDIHSTEETPMRQKEDTKETLGGDCEEIENRHRHT